MKRLLKIAKQALLFIAILMSITFISILNVNFALAEGTVSTIQQNQVVKDTSKNVKKVDSSIPEKNLQALTHIPKTGFKHSFFKFLIAMFGVFVSALAIFGGLKLYKKFALNKSAKFDKIDYDKSLESPKDFKGVINLFLDKTDK